MSMFPKEKLAMEGMSKDLLERIRAYKKDYPIARRTTAFHLAKWMHNAYEVAAENNEWRTQSECQVEFEMLPRQNKNTMIDVAQAILNELFAPPPKNGPRYQWISVDKELPMAHYKVDVKFSDGTVGESWWCKNWQRGRSESVHKHITHWKYKEKSK